MISGSGPDNAPPPPNVQNVTVPVIALVEVTFAVALTDVFPFGA